MKRWLLAFTLSACVIGALPAALARESYDVLERRFWAILKKEWGVSRRDPGAVQLFSADVTCDGEADFIAGRVNKDNDYGAAFEVMIYDGAYYEEVALHYTKAFEQYGICGEAGQGSDPELIVEPKLEPEDVQEIIGQAACGIPIAIDDHLCDAPRIFWDNEAKENTPRIIVFRR